MFVEKYSNALQSKKQRYQKCNSLLKEYKFKHGVLKENDENDLSLYCVICDITYTKDNSGVSYTRHELKTATFEYITYKQETIVVLQQGMVSPAAPSTVSQNRYAYSLV